MLTTVGQPVVTAIFRAVTKGFIGCDDDLNTPALLGKGVKRPRLWGIILITGAIPPILPGISLSGCYITANGQCFESFDQAGIPVGIPLLITSVLLILAGLMVLTTAPSVRSPRPAHEGGAVIRNPRGRGLGPWGRWALALIAVATISTAAAFLLPWWEVRGTDGTSSTLYYGAWCNTISTGRYAGPSECFPYSGLPGIPFPGDFVFAMLVLRVVVTAGAVSLAIGMVGFAVPRVRARAPGFIAAAVFVGTALTALAVADAVLTIPGLEPFLLDWEASGFSGGTIRYNVNFAWGPAAAWYLLFLAAGTGLLGLIAMRAAFQSPRRTAPRAAGSSSAD